jgi:flavin reductase (DIM6/NTAB) family NADH-FMN oxidoreductase RutF
VPILKKILHKFINLHYRQEYLCFALERFEHPLHVYVTDDSNNVITDVSATHLFVGYKPVIIALPAIDATGAEKIKLLFTTKPIMLGRIANEKRVVASLTLEKLNEFSDEGKMICFFSAIKGTNGLLNSVQKLAGYISNKLYNNKPGNVYLPGNLYHQVQIAYAVPRKICLITVGSNDKFNLFPTDLHGRYNAHYIISLRKDGKACAQVEAMRNILISDMAATSFKEVYALGKNHMKEIKEAAAFNFSAVHSAQLHLPIPSHAIRYKELELLSSFDCGIHRLLIFNILNEQTVDKTGETLAHVHNVYATWRYRQHIDREDFYLKR